MKKIQVELADRSYPIFIGKDILKSSSLWRDVLKDYQKICIVTNDSIAPLYLDSIKHSIQKTVANSMLVEVILNDGEQYKNNQSISLIYDQLMQHSFNRDSLIIALGGGVIGDMAGFAAATFLRGIDFVQIPTTLLAQVDSSVGGKTGINHPLGKNMIGSFHQPRSVIIDIATLSSLPKRQIKAGLSEVIKYGLIIDANFYAYIENSLQEILNLDPQACTTIIERSCQIKAEIVSQDEKEHGLRAILNLGHTFGHAIESCLHYKQWLHGEAIATGMMMAATMSYKMDLISGQDQQRIADLFQAAELPITPPAGLNASDILKAMGNDKKILKNQIRLILLNSIGKAYVDDNYAVQTFHQTVDDFFK